MNNVYEGVFKRFENGDGQFVCYARQSSQSVSAMYNLYRAADQASFPGDDDDDHVLRRARSYSRAFLRQRRASGQLNDKWIISEGLPDEVTNTCVVWLGYVSNNVHCTYALDVLPSRLAMVWISLGERACHVLRENVSWAIRWKSWRLDRQGSLQNEHGEQRHVPRGGESRFQQLSETMPTRVAWPQKVQLPPH